MREQRIHPACCDSSGRTENAALQPSVSRLRDDCRASMNALALTRSFVGNVTGPAWSSTTWPHDNQKGPPLRGGPFCDAVVGVTGFEPAASSSRTTRATKLRHTPLQLGKSTPSGGMLRTIAGFERVREGVFRCPGSSTWVSSARRPRREAARDAAASLRLRTAECDVAGPCGPRPAPHRATPPRGGRQWRRARPS